MISLAYSYISQSKLFSRRGLVQQFPNLFKFHRYCTTVAENVDTNIDSDMQKELYATELPTNDNNENLLRIRHTTAHVMAMAVQRLFPNVKVTIGPWIENGFAFYMFLYLILTIVCRFICTVVSTMTFLSHPIVSCQKLIYH